MSTASNYGNTTPAVRGSSSRGIPPPQRARENYELPLSPISLKKVALFVAYLGQQGLSISTIKSYLAGLRYFHLLGNPADMSPSLQSPYIKLILWGVKRANAQKQLSLV